MASTYHRVSLLQMIRNSNKKLKFSFNYYNYTAMLSPNSNPAFTAIQRPFYTDK